MSSSNKGIDFESSLKELESIVKKLEDENINLEDSVKSFEAGINLVKECQKQLEDAELKVKELLDDDDNLYAGSRHGDIVRFYGKNHEKMEVFAHVGGHP